MQLDRELAFRKKKIHKGKIRQAKSQRKMLHNAWRNSQSVVSLLKWYLRGLSEGHLDSMRTLHQNWWISKSLCIPKVSSHVSIFLSILAKQTPELKWLLGKDRLPYLNPFLLSSYTVLYIWKLKSLGISLINIIHCPVIFSKYKNLVYCTTLYLIIYLISLSS